MAFGKSSVNKSSIKKKLFVIGIIFLLTPFIWLTYRYNVLLKNILTYKNIHLKCSGIVTDSIVRQSEIILLLDLAGKNDEMQIRNITYIFNNQIKGSFNSTKNIKYLLLDLKSNDWIKLYFKRQPYSQVRYLYRALNKNNYSSCDLLKELIYLTGIIPDKVLYRIELSSGSYIYRGVNINIKDLVRILKILDSNGMQLNQLIFTKLEVIPTKVLLEDGTYVNAYTFSNIFPVVKNLIRSASIEAEGVTIEIYNATDKTGYATYWSTVFKGVGFKVTRIGTAMKLPLGAYGEKQYWLYVSPQALNSKSFRYIQNLLGKENIYLSQSRPDTLVTTGDIVVILLK